MADEKEIAKLQFDISKAEGQLQTLDDKLKQLAFNSNISSSKNDLSKVINFDKVKKEFDSLEKLGKNRTANIANFAIKKNIEVNAKREIENAKIKSNDEKLINSLIKNEDSLANYRQKKAAETEAANIKHANKMEEIYARQANSTKTIWDRMANTANAYLVTRGLSELRNAAVGIVNEMTEVQYKMVEIDRVLNDSSLDVQGYRDKLIQLAYDYGNSFDNVSDVTLRLAQAGFDANESLALTEKTLLALNTAELNATQATEDMVAVMSQWNLMSGDAATVSADYAKIIDEINITADNFPTTSQDILEALKKTSSAFNIAGASIEETIATIVAAEKASQRGGKAIGTAMNNIIQKLRDTKAMATMEAMGLDVYTDSAKTEFKSVMDILSELSSKMQELKNAGKENSKEMQELLSVFTLFRRNVGTSLLGEMEEGGTYEQVMNLLGKNGEGALGYSLQENEKHMKTARAAMEQFNATLLQLKTVAWDNGGENAFRGLLMLGTDIAKMFNTLIKTFGALPTVIGMVTLAFTAFNKTLQATRVNEKTMTLELNSDLIKAIRNLIIHTNTASTSLRTISGVSRDVTGSFTGAKGQIQAVSTAMDTATGSAVALKIASIALNAAWSLGISLIITGLVSAIDKYIHSAENFRKKQEDIIDKSTEMINKNNEEINTIEKLVAEYEKYANIQGPLTKEEQEAITASQKEMSEYLINNNKYTAEMVGNYELQLETLKKISEEQRQQRRENAKEAAEAAKRKRDQFDVSDRFGDKAVSLENAGIDLSDYYEKTFSVFKGLGKFDKLNYEEQIEYLTKWKEQLEQTGQVVDENTGEYTKAYETVKELLDSLNGDIEETEEQLAKINEIDLQDALEDFLDEHDIQNVEDYKKALEDISNIKPPEDSAESVEEFQAALQQMVENTFPQFQESLDGTIVSVRDNFVQLASELETLSSHFDMVTKAADEFNQYGAISASTFKNIAENDLIQYLDIVNGQMVVNSQYFEEAANAAKEKAIADLEERAAAEILNIVTADLNGTLEQTLSSGNDAAAGINVAANEAINAANKFLQGQAAAEQFKASLDKLAGRSIGNFSGLSEKAQKQIANVTKELDREKAMINSLASGVTKASKAAASSAGRAGKSAGGAAKSATKTFEEQSAERVKIFKKEIDDLEKLEKSWVNKYKKLELFSTSDLKFITHQRINRFNEYLNQINNLQGISEKDRAELIQEYSSKRQEAELEYFDLLKQQLEDQINDLKKANQERIKGIEEAADAQIDALKRVEDENDKVRQKEEYERKRNELIYGNQGIEYWRQRTGRDAQLALQDAEEKLRDLDQDWEDKKKDWTLDDQIEQIEKARDAQIKAIEDAQERQIEGWKAAYQQQVQLYAETGQIIYDDSVINAGYLYNAYMDNFVNPLQFQLQNVIASLNTASATATEVANKVGSSGGGGGGGGGGSAAAIKSTTANIIGPQPVSVTGMPTWKDIQSRNTKAKANSVIQTALSAAKKLIGKFHGGGMVGSSTEALALLRPQEVVLTPEWAAGMNKLVKQINTGSFTGGNVTSIEVQGNLVNMDGVEIKDRKDVDYLKDTVIREVEKKLNVRK